MKRENLLAFAMSLCQLTSLEEFRLSISCSDLSHLTQTQRARQMVLDWEQHPLGIKGIDDKALATICYSLKTQARHLRVFGLEIGSRKETPTLTSSGLSSVADLLSRCVKLENLYLSCLDEQNQSTLTKLFKAMQNTNNLNSLFLNLRGKDTPDTQLDLFSKVLLRNCGLRELYIFLNDFSGFTDLIMPKFSEALSALEDLRTIALEFKHCPKLTNVTLYYIMDTLKWIDSLERAELCFILEECENRSIPKKVLGPATQGNIRIYGETLFTQKVRLPTL